MLILPLCILIMQCNIDTPEPKSGNNSARSIINYELEEEKIYSDVTVDDPFSSERVVVVLKKAASMNFKTYSPKDFPEIPCTSVTDSTDQIMETVRLQIEAEKTGDWSKLEKNIELGMLVDVKKFRRILDIHLPTKDKESVIKAIKLLEKRDDILYVGPDYIVELCEYPNPSPAYLNNQMNAFNNTSLPTAWDIVTGATGENKGIDIQVGVLDTGIQADHPAFADRVTTGYDFTTGVAGGIWGGLQDPNSHGSHVAGIIGANGTGVIGVCWGVNLVSLRVLDASGYGTNSYIREAVNRAHGLRIPILNFSGGGTNYDAALYTAIQNYAGIFICAAGNDKKNNDITGFYPASFNLNNLISVGALNEAGNAMADEANWGSNYGAASVDIFAPGTKIYSTINNSSYGYKSGTSMAAPFVTGVAALIKFLHPNMVAQNVKTAILSQKDIVLNLNTRCVVEGKLNANKAVTEYIQIAGYANLYFNGNGINFVNGGTIGKKLVGKFYLFQNGRWAIVEKGQLFNPIVYNPYQDPDLLEFELVGNGVKNFMLQYNIGNIEHIHANLRLLCSSSNGINYWDMPYCINIRSNNNNINTQVAYSGERYFPYGSYSATDKRKVSMSNHAGGY